MELSDLADMARSERVQEVFGHPEWSDSPTIPEYQAKLLDYGESKDRAQTAPQKGRQVGATTVAGLIGADHAVASGPRGTDVLFAAPSQGTANEMFRECKKLFWESDFTLSEFGVTNDNKETWEFADGTRILARTLGNVEQQNNSGNRGMNPTCVIVDEAAYEKSAVYTEEIEPFFLTHDSFEFHLFSTPAGKSGYFYGKAGAEDNDNPKSLRDYEAAVDESWSWYAPYWPTRISPFTSKEFIDRKREELDRATFEQEYLGYFTEAEGSAIPHETLVKNIKPDAERNPAHARYVAIDPARKGSDDMVAVDLDRSGRCWNIWAFEDMSGPKFVGFVQHIHTNGPYPQPEVGTATVPTNGYESILIEENGVGGFGADFAQAGVGDVVKVFRSSNKSKQNGYQRLLTDLEAEELALPNHDTLIRQCERLQKTFTPSGKAKYEHPQGEHDDYPDALMMANWARHGHGQRLQATQNSGTANPTFSW